jgi:hypothetical protein
LSAAEPVAVWDTIFGGVKPESVVAQIDTGKAYARGNDFNWGASAEEDKSGEPRSHQLVWPP